MWMMSMSRIVTMQGFIFNIVITATEKYTQVLDSALIKHKVLQNQ